MPVRTTSTGRYEARFSHKGIAYSKTFSRKRDAERWEEKARSRAEMGMWAATPPTTTVGVACQNYIDANRALADATRRRYQVSLENQILPHGPTANCQLDQLTSEVLTDWVTWMQNQDWSANTIRNAMAVMRASLTQLHNQGLITRNPATGVKIPRVPIQIQRIPTTEEVRLISDWFDTNGTETQQLLLELALWTGARWGELMAVRPCDVDVRGELQITRAWDAKGNTFKETKGRKNRAVPLSPELQVRLRGLPYFASELLFSSNGLTPWSHGSFMTNHWERMRQDCGLDRQLTFHTLRHYRVSEMIRAGASPVTVSRWIGHSRPSVTLDVYGHLFTNDLQELSERMVNLRG